VTGTAVTADVGSPSPPTVEVIFYLPGHETARRTVQHAGGRSTPGTFTIDTPNIAAGTYDVVVRPIYSEHHAVPVNCPTDLYVVTGISSRRIATG
jgi:hypothetical protein